MKRFPQALVMNRPSFYTACLALAMTNSHAWTYGQSASNQPTIDGYRLPPKEIVEIIDAKPEPTVSLSPDAQWMVFASRDAMPEISDLARRRLSLAGLRIDPATDSTFQTNFFRGLSLRRRDDTNMEPKSIPIKQPTRIGTISWSHNSKSFVYTVVEDNRTELWYVSVDAPDQPVKLTDRLSGTLFEFNWFPDGRRILCTVIPEDRGHEPKKPVAPLGPNIQESYGTKSPVRTYQDLLASPYDEALFDHYCTTQLVILEPDEPMKKIGSPKIYLDVSISPDSLHLLTTTVKPPYSYQLTVSSFPKQISVLSLEGTEIYRVADVPLEDGIPIEGVRLGPRSIRWKPGDPATLVWTEALDGGDPKKKVPHREQLRALHAPFDSTPRDLLRLEHRFSGFSFFADSKLMMVTEIDRDRRWTRSLLYDWHRLESPPMVLVDRSIRDIYGDPGRMLTKPDERGDAVVYQDGPWVYLAGAGASPEGNLPFLDRKNLETLETQRLWRCTPGTLESVASLLPNSCGDKPQFVTRRESPNDPLNYFLRDLARETEQALTDFKDPTPQLRQFQKRVVKYERSDGVPLSATLYLPAGYELGTKLPLIVWAYPLEFSDANTAGQVSANPSSFTRISGISHLTLLTQGYAIMDNATMPVIGDPESMNDTFIEQIVEAARAAIDHAVSLGVADGNRVGVGGHSYGAFMTANLLAHCNLFKAGVARSGAYNRTLTPFGFQAERRPIWEAKEVYANISPFMHADKIKTPLLLVHGEEDNNPGTFPIQSQRMYQAIKGNGGSARIVMLPHESHSYVARQSVLHTQAEMVDWFNRYVRDAQSPDTQSSDTALP